MRRSELAAVWLLCLAPLQLHAAPQSVAPTLATSPTTQTVEDVLHHLSDRAGVIFIGQVLATRQSAGVAEIDFRVDTPILGCTPGPYTLREWAGLWTTNGNRYRVGQRLLMFLYPPGRSGMSSPVEGLHGAVPVRQASSSDAAVAAGPYVDLRWLATRLQRAIAYAPTPSPRSETISQATQLVRAGTASTVANLISANAPLDSSIPAQQASLPYIVSVLTTWHSPANQGATSQGAPHAAQ